MKKSDLFREVLGNYKNIVNKFDLAELVTRAPVRSSHKLIFKKLMLQAVKEGTIFIQINNNFLNQIFHSHFIGKSVWEKYKSLKSLLLNHEQTHFPYKSGDNLDDAIERAKKNLLLHKQNKLINATKLKNSPERRFGVFHCSRK